MLASLLVTRVCWCHFAHTEPAVAQYFFDDTGIAICELHGFDANSTLCKEIHEVYAEDLKLRLQKEAESYTQDIPDEISRLLDDI